MVWARHPRDKRWQNKAQEHANNPVNLMIVSLGVFHVFDQDKSQKLINMSVSYNSSIKVFQTLGTRAALVTDSSRSTLQSIMEEG